MSGAFESIRWAKNVPPMKCPDGRADTSAHYVLLVLATYAAANGSNARPSITTLARETYLSERTVSEALKRLQDNGLIASAGDLNGTTVWRLVLTKTRGPDDAATIAAFDAASWINFSAQPQRAGSVPRRPNQ